MTTSTGKVTNRKPFVQKQDRCWWTRNRFFFWYMIREGTSIFVLLYSLILANGVFRLSQGEAAWNHWLASLNHPAYIAFHFIALVAAMYHAYTWFKLAPKIMVVRFGDWTLPAQLMEKGQWAAFFAISLALLAIGLFWGV